MGSVILEQSWQMWVTIAIVLAGVGLYALEKFSIEMVSAGILAVLVLFFQFFTPENASNLDATIKPYLGRLPEELDAIEKAILRIATLELTERIDVPYRVIINEAIELAKAFGAEESHKFINGALDKAVRTLRKDERD